MRTISGRVLGSSCIRGWVRGSTAVWCSSYIGILSRLRRPQSSAHQRGCKHSCIAYSRRAFAFQMFQASHAVSILRGSDVGVHGSTCSTRARRGPTTPSSGTPSSTRAEPHHSDEAAMELTARYACRRNEAFHDKHVKPRKEGVLSSNFSVSGKDRSPSSRFRWPLIWRLFSRWQPKIFARFGALQLVLPY